MGGVGEGGEGGGEGDLGPGGAWPGGQGGGDGVTGGEGLGGGGDSWAIRSPYNEVLLNIVKLAVRNHCFPHLQ